MYNRSLILQCRSFSYHILGVSCGFHTYLSKRHLILIRMS